MARNKQTAKKKAKKATKALARITKSKKPDFVDELAALGRRVEGALKSAVKSKEARAVQEEVSKSIKTVGMKLLSAVEAARKSEDAQGLEEQAKKVFRTGTKSGLDTAKQAQANLSAGLKGISKELEKLAQKVKKGKR
ncbi:MAG: hypothetical protein AUJ52_08630 [Elusimicrobia bacterium CG1_02_63_36]|nr:MAG: hypothetical protein AUJ52_08630 [Elusimicrobia bacterium CG1_02_63_36]PIP81819.1 MAG: hypothetical protein COR54_18055 [Elusimicrobia bacterium CG22_combo_CG10-13_8_21_14_all_63_91]PJA11496.1 MAG: hypothetical protein COX66_19605 [Elusimicrobia bacterium CG_4_10_14_0_2_um_filter_63_34]PJB24331.1 MAG: hypothetical protein CO113_14295 [Elusimicrobia bacterium CG_4_9_14_3_um_filter_62_55]